MINECNPMLLNKNVKNIITIISEMIRPVNKKTENYITITEFSNITGIKHASIKTTLLQKGYISSKFKTIPTRTAICKDVVKIRLYKHYKNPDLDITFHWRKSFLISILNSINKEMKPTVKVFNYRKPKKHT